MIREELNRALLNRSLLIPLCLGIGALGYGLSDYGTPTPYTLQIQPFLYNAYDAVIWAETGPIGLILPLLAVLPFADSYAVDCTSGYLRHVLMRASFKRYWSAKIFVNLLAGGVAIAVPILLLFLYTNIAFPRGLLPPKFSRIGGAYPFGPLPHLYRTVPDLYILFLATLGFIFGATYATLSLAISTFTSNRYVILATPFLLYHIANFVLALLGLAQWTPPATFSLTLATKTSGFTVLGELGGIFAISMICLLLFMGRNKIQA